MPHTSWFEQLTGFAEHTVADVAAHFAVDGPRLTSLVNGRTMVHGTFEAPSLGELRARSASTSLPGRLRVREVVADVRALHVDPENAGAMFQVASQLNALEMVSPHVTPEAGVTGYVHDGTQGPACAMACAAGTIFRNYLVPLGEQRGQSADRQVNTLTDLLERLGVEIEVRNGYALPTAAQLDALNAAIGSDHEDHLQNVRIGVQSGTEVTRHEAGHVVSQAYCSAMPIGYTDHGVDRWEPFARLVLDAAYEATLHAAVINATSGGSDRVYLTSLGGGVFTNPEPWILAAMTRALRRVRDAGVALDVAIVSHRAPKPALQPLLDELGA